jgi:hypothetical protein
LAQERSAERLEGSTDQADEARAETGEERSRRMRAEEKKEKRGGEGREGREKDGFCPSPIEDEKPSWRRDPR